MEASDIFDESRLQPDANEFDPAADLDELLVQAMENPGYRPEFFRRLLQSKLHLLLEEEVDMERAVGMHVPLRPLQSEGLVVVFTSAARVLDRPDLPAYPFIDIKGRDLLEAVQDTGIILNPFADQAIVLQPEQIRKLLSGQGPMTLQQDNTMEEEVTIGLPEKYPAGLVEALQTVMSSMPRLRCAYALYVMESSVGRPRFAVYLDAEGDIERMAQDIGSVAKAFFSDTDSYIDILEAAEDQGLFSGYVVSTPPIYQRD
jgi:hypothetical protein